MCYLENGFFRRVKYITNSAFKYYLLLIYYIHQLCVIQLPLHRSTLSPPHRCSAVRQLFMRSLHDLLPITSAPLHRTSVIHAPTLWFIANYICIHLVSTALPHSRMSGDQLFIRLFHNLLSITFASLNLIIHAPPHINKASPILKSIFWLYQ